MENLKLKVITKDNEVKLFDKGIVGAYFYVGSPTEVRNNPEYILEVFFNENKEFEGILLNDNYKHDLKDCLQYIIESEVSQDIREYELLRSISVINNEIHRENYDICECKKCSYLTEWNDCDI